MSTNPHQRPIGKIIEPVLEWMEAHPGREVSRRDVARAIPPHDDRDQDFWEKAVGQALNQLGQRGFVGRLRVGRYIYPADLAPPYEETTRHRGPADGEVPADLRPLTNLDPEVYKEVGLQPVGKAADGSRICVDDQGQVWKVRVSIEARLV